jgi:hypothetical protein
MRNFESTPRWTATEVVSDSFLLLSAANGTVSNAYVRERSNPLFEASDSKFFGWNKKINTSKESLLLVEIPHEHQNNWQESNEKRDSDSRF